MKKLFLFTLTVLLTVSLSAQLKIDMTLLKNPPATLTEWANHPELLNLIISAQPGAPVQKFVIKVEFQTADGTVVGTNDLTRSVVYTTSSTGTPTILHALEVVQMEIMVFNGKYRTSLQKTGKLPSDTYMLCVQLVRPVDFSNMAGPLCKVFYMSSIQLPILVKPYNEEILDTKAAQTAITFRWTPVIPRLSEPVTYRLQIFEVYNEQNAFIALRNNQPILDQQITSMTQFVWQPHMLFDLSSDTAGLSTQLKLRLEKGKMFIWVIQSLDVNGNPVTQSDGNGLAFSEPEVFFIRTGKR